MWVSSCLATCPVFHGSVSLPCSCRWGHFHCWCFWGASTTCSSPIKAFYVGFRWSSYCCWSCVAGRTGDRANQRNQALKPKARPKAKQANQAKLAKLAVLLQAVWLQAKLMQLVLVPHWPLVGLLRCWDPKLVSHGFWKVRLMQQHDATAFLQTHPCGLQPKRSRFSHLKGGNFPFRHPNVFLQREMCNHVYKQMHVLYIHTIHIYCT